MGFSYLRLFEVLIWFLDWRNVNGWLSTYVLGFVVVFEGHFLSNPDLGVRLLEDVGLGAYAPLILSLAAFTYDFLYPRASSTFQFLCC